ncbi:MAG: hypothetical protein HY355_07160 [Armatimonadetes bacterium]|nr:hypothetical protein [Armatimonadota bacterium]
MLLTALAGTGIWGVVHVGQLLGILLVVGGLVGFSRSIAGAAAAALARLGLVSGVISGAVAVVLVGIGGLAERGIALAWLQAPAAEKAAAFRVAAAVAEIEIAIDGLFLFLYFGVTPLLFGAATALSSNYPRWLGWVAIAAGAVWVVLGLVQVFTGSGVLLTNRYFPIFLTPLAAWGLAMGILLGRQLGPAPPAAPPRRAIGQDGRESPEGTAG